LCSPAGRGIPDISAQAIQFNVVVDNRPLRVDGTSCATPVQIFLLPPLCVVQLIANVQTVAGIISLLNDYRLSKGKGPLGWLNPLLYDRGLAGLNDITSGSNPGCNTEDSRQSLDGIPFVITVSLFSALTDFGLRRSQVSGRRTL